MIYLILVLVPEPHLKVKHQHVLRLSDNPVSGTLDVVVRRKHYKTLPIQWKQDSASRAGPEADSVNKKVLELQRQVTKARVHE